MNPTDLLATLYEKVGPHHYDRVDVTFDPAQRDEIRQRIQVAGPSTLGGKPVLGIDETDGVRFMLEGGYWALVRFSGTEPLLRIYAEAESPASVAAILDEARTLAGV